MALVIVIARIRGHVELAPGNGRVELAQVALGGGHELDNLRPCCRRCNSSMGASMGNRLRGARPVTTWRTSRRW
jgi:5-methylcytosine-specific restriction endonuclease McrA